MSLSVKLHRFKILKCKSDKYARLEFRGEQKITSLLYQEEDYLVVNRRFDWVVKEPVGPGEVLVLHLLSRTRWGSHVTTGVYRLGLQIVVNDGHLFVTDSLVDDRNKPVMSDQIKLLTRLPVSTALREAEDRVVWKQLVTDSVKAFQDGHDLQ